MVWQSLMMAQILAVLQLEGFQPSQRAKQSCATLIREVSSSGATILEALDCAVAGMTSTTNYLSIASDSEQKAAFKSFLQATSNNVLHASICGVCTREFRLQWCLKCFLHAIPHLHHLVPDTLHPHMILTDGLLLAEEVVYATSDGHHAMSVCYHCNEDLVKNHLPLYGLTNGLWIGRVPSEVKSLTIPEQMLIVLVYPCCFVFKMHPITCGGQDPSALQCGMVGKITSYDMDTTEIIAMLEG